MSAESDREYIGRFELVQQVIDGIDNLRVFANPWILAVTQLLGCNT